MKVVKLLVVMFMLLPFVFQGCTNTEEDATTEKNVEKAQQLAKSYGATFEVTDPNAITAKSLQEMEEKLKRIRKQFKKPLKLKYTITDGTKITFLKNKNSLLVAPLKTRAEVMEGSWSDYDFKITIEWSKDDNKLIAKYEVTYNSSTLSVSEDSCDIKDSETETTIDCKIRVIQSVGGGYMHISFKIEGSYDKDKKEGKLTITQGK